MSTQPQLSPLEQWDQETKSQQQPQQKPASQLSPLEQWDQETQQSTPTLQQTGEVTNDVGQTVIVPKDGESFEDTVHRAVAHQKSMTPQQQQSAIDAEVKSAPGKLPAVAGGVIGAASLPVIEGLAPEAISAARSLFAAHPVAAKVLGKMILSSALGGEVGHSAKTAIIGAMLGGLL